MKIDRFGDSVISVQKNSARKLGNLDKSIKSIRPSKGGGAGPVKIAASAKTARPTKIAKPVRPSTLVLLALMAKSMK